MNLLEQTMAAIHVPDTELSSAVDAALSAQTSRDFGHLRSILLRYVNITG